MEQGLPAYAKLWRLNVEVLRAENLPVAGAAPSSFVKVRYPPAVARRNR